MSPEQAAGLDVDERSDIYALGAILYELVCGRPPHGHDADWRQVLVRARDHDPSPVRDVAPDAPADLAAIITRAIARNREQRYATAAALAEDLDRFLRRRVLKPATAVGDRLHSGVYARPWLYEMAFSYRDIRAECDFLLHTYQDLVSRAPERILDVACGPGVHARQLASRGFQCAALDSSAEMVDYAAKISRADALPIECFRADMADFSVSSQFDMAINMLDSLTYLHDNEAVLRHFNSVADALVDDGLYVIDLSHPSELFCGSVLGRSEWEIESELGRLHVRWAQIEGSFDPVTQCSCYDVQMRHIAETGDVEELRDVSVQRAFTWNELDALIRCSGRLRTMELRGALDRSSPFVADAGRMVVVLQRAS
jgi:SAM-dependent methyltransferase